MWPATLGLLAKATGQTVVMVFAASAFAIGLGLPLGVLLFVTQHRHFGNGLVLHRLVAAVVDVVRSIPFIILMVAITPLTHFIVGSAIGTLAAVVPLSLAAIPFYGRIVESALQQVPAGLIEAAMSMGARPLAIIVRVLLPESLPALVRGATLMIIALIGYSAMAGAVGGGGIGDVAIRYGYQRFKPEVMLITVVILVLLVQCCQWLGDRLATRLAKHRE